MILDEIALICLLAMAEMVSSYGGNIPPGHDEKAVVCLEVARAADDMELPIALVVSVAYEESKFERELTSKAGAKGPLQIIPRYHCPSPEGEHKPHKRRGTLQGCDLVRDGVKAVKWFWETYDFDWPRALAHYNSGEKVYSSSRAYARRIQRRARRINRQLNAIYTAEATR
tara:strand:- start:2364 stop:2876 length:513 start_codon:yes stop_codon:yes gene_type:complete